VSRARSPRVVALGGGHGLATALHSVTAYAGDVTAVVSVADDGGSSGRLRRDLGVPAPGDLRKALSALAPDEDAPWARVLEHRFDGGELSGHALGNLVLVGLAATLGSLEAALAELGRLLGAQGRVLPATAAAVVLTADVDGREVAGQVEVSSATGRIRRVALAPPDVPACPAAVDAIGGADQVVIAPGSLYTSVIAALCVPGIRDAVASTTARVVAVLNLATQAPETEGLDGTDHLRAILDHGGRVDVVVHQDGGALAFDPAAARALGVEPVAADVAAAGGRAHDPARLGAVLARLVPA
jgi:uncharacterized cofD-like protein